MDNIINVDNIVVAGKTQEEHDRIFLEVIKLHNLFQWSKHFPSKHFN